MIFLSCAIAKQEVEISALAPPGSPPTVSQHAIAHSKSRDIKTNLTFRPKSRQKPEQRSEPNTDQQYHNSARNPGQTETKPRPNPDQTQTKPRPDSDHSDHRKHYKHRVFAKLRPRLGSDQMQTKILTKFRPKFRPLRPKFRLKLTPHRQKFR